MSLSRTGFNILTGLMQGPAYVSATERASPAYRELTEGDEAKAMIHSDRSGIETWYITKHGQIAHAEYLEKKGSKR